MRSSAALCQAGSGEARREIPFRENERSGSVRRDRVRIAAGSESEGESGDDRQAQELIRQALCRLEGAPGSGILFGVKRVACSLAVIAIIGLVQTAVAADTSISSKPSLRLVDRSPASIGGSGFRAREQVRLIFTSNGVWQEALRATQAGKFTAVFPGATIDRCVGFVVIARGQRGSVATLRGMPFACPPP